MRNTLRNFIGGIAAVALTMTLATAGAQAASPPSTPVQLSSSQVAQALFVAGDVGRLSQVPSGTESLVEEKILQQLYIANPTLPVDKATSDIQALQATLGASSAAISPATLTVMSGNQRVLAILRALTDSGPAQDVAAAIAQVDNQALTQASASDYLHGQWFDASADSLDTIDFEGFSPATVLAASASLAQANKLFGQARDALWQGASHESVFDDTQTLLKGNPALQNSAVQQLVGMLGSDGSLQTTVGQLETLVSGDLATIDNQQCTLAGGASGGSPSDCTSGALHDALMVSGACQSQASTACTDAKNQDQSDTTAELATIAQQQAASTAAADVLDQADQTLGQSELAESQAAAQLADQEQQYLAWQSFQQTFKAGTDLVSLAVTLSVSEVDPVGAVSGLLNVIGDALGFSFSGPDPNTLILQGIQNLSQQLYDFESYTQTAFSAISMQLSGISSQVAADSLKLSTQLAQVQGTLNVLSGDLSTLQTSVDHLQNEIQSLFASANWDSLRSQIDQYLGYQHQNGVALPQTQFATAAGQLLSDAQNTAVSQTEVSPPGPFDSLDADSLVTGSDPLTLDTNINYFNLFGNGVNDSPSGVTWPGALTTTCATGANVAAGICLPDPDYWATASRAFGQLLMENPSYVTSDRLQELQSLNQEGQTIAGALSQLSSNDAGADTGGVNNAGKTITGTGNKRLDAALGYYAYWAGEYKKQTTSAPPLPIAVQNAQNTILTTTNTPGVVTGSNYGSAGVPYAGVDPWSGPDQIPDVNNIAKLASLQNVEVCQSENKGGFELGNNFDFATTDLLPAADPINPLDLYFLSDDVTNAVRLGQGTLSACYTAQFVGSLSATGGQLNVSLFFFYTGGSYTNEPVGELDFSGNENYCGTGNGGNQWGDAVNAIGLGCNAAAINNLFLSNLDGQRTEGSDVDTYTANQFNQARATLQQTIYTGLINGTHLTQGTNPNVDDVEAAAGRAGGANALLNGYISLGLPQALASDDTLNGLVNGTGSDPFAWNDTFCGLNGVVPGGTIESELINYIQAADVIAAGGVATDTSLETCISALVQDRVGALTSALSPHIIPSSTGGTGARASRVAGAAAQPEPSATASTVFAEDNPLIAPTLDRLDDTQAALADELANGVHLTVEVDGTGAGTVTGGGVNCNSGSCSAGETPQSTVTLTATPASGSTFTGWSGACTGTGTCTVALPYDQNVIATFSSGGPVTATTTPTPTTPAGTPTGTTSPAGHAAKCTLKVTSNKVLLAAPKGKAKKGAPKPGTLTLTVKCDQAGRVRLTGTLTQLIGAKPKHRKQKSKAYGLGAVNATVKAGKLLTLTVKLPAAAVSALGAGAKESAAFTVTVTNANGAGRATVKIATLKGTR